MVPVYGSPFSMLALHSSADPLTTTIVGDGLVDSIVGLDRTLTVSLFDSAQNAVTSGGNVVTARLQHSNGLDAYAGIVTDNGDGSYGVTYSVQTSGDYKLHVRLGGESVQGSPYDVTFVPSDIDGSKCISDWEETREEISNVLSTFTIFGRDQFSNERPFIGSTTVAISLTNTENSIFGTFALSGDDIVCSFLPTKIGTYEMDVKVDGASIVGIPLKVTIKPGAVESIQSLATGVGLSEGIAGEEALSTLFPHDAHANTVPLTLDNAKASFIGVMTSTDSATVVNCGLRSSTKTGFITAVGSVDTSTEFVLVCVPERATDYNLAITWASNPISGSSFSVTISPTTASELSTVVNRTYLRSEPSSVEVNDDIIVHIQAIDRFTNVVPGSKTLFSSQLRDSNDLIVDEVFPLPHDTDALYKGIHTVKTSGDYTLDLKIWEASIFGMIRGFRSSDCTETSPPTPASTFIDLGSYMSDSNLESNFVVEKALFDSLDDDILSIEVETHILFSQGVASLTLLSPSVSPNLIIRMTELDARVYFDDKLVGDGWNDAGSVIMISLDSIEDVNIPVTLKMQLRSSNGYPLTQVGNHGIKFFISGSEGEHSLLNGALFWPKHADESPYSIVALSEPVSKSDCIATGSGLSLSMAGVTTGFQIHPRDKFQNSVASDPEDWWVVLLPTHPSDDSEGVSWIEGIVSNSGSSDHELEVAYMITKNGSYQLWILHNVPAEVKSVVMDGSSSELSRVISSYSISPAAYVVEVSSNVPSSVTSLISGITTLEAGVKSSFTVDGKDIFNNPILASDVDFGIQWSDASIVSVDSITTKDDIITVEYTITGTGITQISPTFSGVVLTNAPLSVNVLPTKTNVTNSYAHALDMKTCKVSSAWIGRITLEDNFQNLRQPLLPSNTHFDRVSVSVAGPTLHELEIEASEWSEGYELSFMPHVAGEHRIDVCIPMTSGITRYVCAQT
eukprot:TRINITY_DN3829_c0_g1_i5.p1 TRINITY_DN3829_c0_g1~~TRINITY_DN3829_c0_g1_i5.p1  ORF type:complete len:1112 (+),score=335.55 TRINITY_DN3829_c0_g1_i5:448-3336(+)